MATRFNQRDQGEVASLLPLVYQELQIDPEKWYSYRLVLVVDRGSGLVRLHALPRLSDTIPDIYLLTLVLFSGEQCWLTLLKTNLDPKADYSAVIWRVIPSQLRRQEDSLDSLMAGLTL